MRNILKTFLLSGAPFGLFMGLFLSLWVGFREGMLAGAIAGFLFGLGIAMFVGVQEKRFKASRSQITGGQSVLMDGGANHFRGAEAVGGWLYLTPNELIFESHQFNIQVHRSTIPLDDVAKVKPVSTLGFIPNGLIVETRDGNVDRFVVNNRDTWIRTINEACRARNRNSQG